MGCLMKNGIATYGNLSHEYYVLKINGRANSIHRHYQDALREGGASSSSQIGSKFLGLTDRDISDLQDCPEAHKMPASGGSGMECAGRRWIKCVGVLHGSILRAGGTCGDEQDEREKAAAAASISTS
jgi:hypothetical protein